MPSWPRAADPSGRERRRTAPYPRAFPKNAPAVSLDEVAALPDPESETRVQQAIAALAKGKTALKVAHRMRTAPHDRRNAALDAAVAHAPSRASARRAGSPLRPKRPLRPLCRLQGIAVGEAAVRNHSTGSLNS